MDVFTPHFAVIGLIDLQMLTQEIGSVHLDLLRVGKRPKCIAQGEQECLQVLPALAIGDVPEDRGDRPALGMSEPGQVDLIAAVERAKAVFITNRLTGESNFPQSLDHGKINVGPHLTHARADNLGANASHGMVGPVDDKKTVIDCIVVVVKQNLKDRHTVVDRFEQRPEVLFLRGGCVQAVRKMLMWGRICWHWCGTLIYLMTPARACNHADEAASACREHQHREAQPEKFEPSVMMGLIRRAVRTAVTSRSISRERCRVDFLPKAFLK